MSINGNTIDGASIGGAAALDEEAYQLWLRDPAATVAHLVEIDYNDVSAVYPNWVVHTIKSADRAGLSFTGYPDRVKSIGGFSRQIGERFTGVVTASYGEIEFENSEGRLDLWHKLSIDGQAVRVYHGDPSWARERFRIVYEGVAEIVAGSTQKALKIRVRSKDYKYNLPIQETLIGTAAPNANSNQPVPKAFGRVFSAEPGCIDIVNQVHQFNDGASTSVKQVRDGGVSFSTSQKVISAVAGDVITTSAAHGFVAGTRLRCEAGSFPTAAAWAGMAWNGEILCAVANGDDVVATSRDGVGWNESVFPIASGARAITCNGAVFCAVGSGTNCAVSGDGENWETGAMPASDNWNGVTWNGSVFCAVSENGRSATSTDGLSWTLGALPNTDASWRAVAWNGEVFCAVRSGATSTDAATSTDGLSWTLQDMINTGYWTGLCWNGSIFCATPSGTSALATLSTDGANWYPPFGYFDPAAMPVVANWNNVAWNGSVFCAVASGSAHVATSSDGWHWTLHSLPASANWDLLAWIGNAFCVAAGSTGYSALSADGETWTIVSNALPAPLAPETDYWVISDGLTTTDFKVSATRGGAAVTLTNTTTGGALIGYHWTADLATSKLYLDQQPAGVLTMDFVAGSDDAADIVISALSAIDVDPTSKARFQAMCSQSVGIYVKERRNRLDVAADIVNGIGAWFGHGRDGMLKFGRINGRPTSWDFAITEDDMYPETLQIEKILPAEKKHRCSYRKNWTNQAGALFAGVSAGNVALYSNDYSVTQPLDSTDVGENGMFHALAVIPDVQETLMYYAADAAAEAARLDEMYFGLGAIISVDLRRVGTLFDMGDSINVNHSRFGLGDGSTLGAGTNMEIVYIEPRPSAGRVAVKFFVAFDAYLPGQL
jgi:hypothetical protein